MTRGEPLIDIFAEGGLHLHQSEKTGQWWIIRTLTHANIKLCGTERCYHKPFDDIQHDLAMYRDQQIEALRKGLEAPDANNSN